MSRTLHILLLLHAFFVFLVPLWGSTASAFPRQQFDDARTHKGHAPPHTSKFCKLFYSVTYHDMWGPLFIEDSYKCNFTSDSSAASVEPEQQLLGTAGSGGGEEPVLQSRRLTTNLHGGDDGEEDGGDENTSSPSSSSSSSSLPGNHLPRNKHQIISFGCLPLPDAEPIDLTRDSTLLYTLPYLTNQSCLPPGHLREYRDYPRPWEARWAFTNINRGSEVICDWYEELGNVAKALNLYCANSFERPGDDESLVEMLAYGRDREREAIGGQHWCLRYSDRGWESSGFDEKCLGVEGGGQEKEEEKEERVQFGEIEL